MDNLCNKCGLCCKYIPVIDGMILRDGKQPIFEGLEPLNNLNDSYAKMVQNLFKDSQIYTCRYLSDNNECLHPQKPEICKNFPSGATSVIPENCGYSGAIFLEKEKLKQKIRKMKEEIIHYEALMQESPKDSENYQKIITARKNYIEKYKDYGSENW